MIIARHTGISNPQAKIKRQAYTVTNSGKKVVRSSAKVQKLGLTARRVANGALFNNETLTYVSLDYAPYSCTVGLKYRGTEYKYEGIPVVWKKDHRKIYRRHIKQADFKALPQGLQDVAKSNGVDVDADYIIFTRCVAAWAGHRLDSSLHCHHANMDTTDDRLGNIQVLTASEHAKAHSNPNDMLWDEEWYEYTSGSMLMLRLQQSTQVGDEDIAKELAALMYVPPGAKKAVEKNYFPPESDDDMECGWVLSMAPPG
jgi:hypothetical protein